MMEHKQIVSSVLEKDMVRIARRNTKLSMAL